MANRNNDNNNTEQPEKKEAQTTALPSNALIEAAARVSGANLLGAVWEEDLNFTHKAKITVPGVSIIRWLPSLGVTGSDQKELANTPLVRAANYWFAELRSKISGNRPYEAGDWMVYHQAVDSLRQLYTAAARIYGLQQAYSTLNMYWPRAVLEGMGFDADEVRNNSPELFFFLARVRESLKPFPTLKIGSTNTDHEAMNGHIYLDANSDRAQAYVFHQVGFWSYEVVDQVKGLTMRSAPTSVAGIIELWDTMYNALMTSSDVNIIAADVLRGYNDSDRILYDLPGVPADYVVPVTTSDAMLLAINNLTVVPAVSPDLFNVRLSDSVRKLARARTDAYLEAFRIEDRAGNLLYVNGAFPMDAEDMRTWRQLCCMWPHAPSHINCTTSVPTPSEVLAYTRFHTDFVLESLNVALNATENGSTPLVRVLSTGTEIVVGMAVVAARDYNTARETMQYINNAGTKLYPRSHVIEILNGTMAQIPGYQAISATSAFDWHPIMCGFINDQTFDLHNLVEYTTPDGRKFKVVKWPAGATPGSIKYFEMEGKFLGYYNDAYHTISLDHKAFYRIHEARILTVLGFTS